MSKLRNYFHDSQSRRKAVMERRHILKITIALVASAAALGASVIAAPLPPVAAQQAIPPSSGSGVEPAVISQDEVDHLKPVQVRWGHHGHHWGWHHHHWHHRHWGWHRHHWHHRHWGWRHRHWGWHHRHW
jgi:hypothetical protein